MVRAALALPLERWMFRDLMPVLEDTLLSPNAKVADLISQEGIRQLMTQSGVGSKAADIEDSGNYTGIQNAAVDALIAGFPAGTVSGAPKIRAMEIINEVEQHKRGIYAGGVGYFGAGGDMDTCIALRTAIVKDGMLYAQAGGGVVLDSDPEAELQETLHKSRALFRAAADAWRYT